MRDICHKSERGSRAAWIPAILLGKPGISQWWQQGYDGVDFYQTGGSSEAPMSCRFSYSQILQCPPCTAWMQNHQRTSYAEFHFLSCKAGRSGTKLIEAISKIMKPSLFEKVCNFRSLIVNSHKVVTPRHTSPRCCQIWLGLPLQRVRFLFHPLTPIGLSCFFSQYNRGTVFQSGFSEDEWSCLGTLLGHKPWKPEQYITSPGHRRLLAGEIM